ncbi:MAG: hypothetical protein K2Q28_07800 [Hyphomicrobium sp.]|nr:hypothetical protein [Hyphomicrobium sp.]
MTHQHFQSGLVCIAALAIALAAVLRIGLGSRWFEFYGWATVAFAAVPFLTRLLWKRLPEVGWSRWWSLLFAVPLLLVATIQIAFWHLFFSQGATNPMFGVVREMVRPWLAAAEPFAVGAFAVVSLWLIIAAARNNASA